MAEDDLHSDTAAFADVAPVHAEVSTSLTRRRQTLSSRAAGPAFISALQSSAKQTPLARLFARFLVSSAAQDIDLEEFLMTLHFLRGGVDKDLDAWRHEDRDDFDDYGWPVIVEDFVFVYLRASAGLQDGDCSDDPWTWWDKAAEAAERAAEAVAEAAAAEVPQAAAVDAARRAALAASAALHAALVIVDEAVEEAATVVAVEAARAAKRREKEGAATATREMDAKWEEFQQIGRRLTESMVDALSSSGAFDGAFAGAGGAMDAIAEEDIDWTGEDDEGGAAGGGGGGGGGGAWIPPPGTIAEMADICQCPPTTALAFVHEARRRGSTSLEDCVHLFMELGGQLPQVGGRGGDSDSGGGDGGGGVGGGGAATKLCGIEDMEEEEEEEEGGAYATKSWK